MLKNGLVQIYRGDADYTCYIPHGLCLRAAGRGLRCLIVNLAPFRLINGTLEASEKLKPYFEVDNTAARAVKKNQGSADDCITAAFERAGKSLLTGGFDLVVLCGILDFKDNGLINNGNLLSLIRNKPYHTEFILTGRHPSQDICSAADLVSDVISESWPSTNRVCGPSIEIITGNGKGKTTYCLGKSLLASCSGKRSTVLQFIKSPEQYGEVIASKNIPLMEITSMGEGFVFPGPEETLQKHRKAAERAWKSAQEHLLSGHYQFIVLDEINVAMSLGLLDPAEVISFLDKIPAGTRLLLSGRNAEQDIINRSGLFIEVREKKHPFNKGIGARKGIEY